jgi:PAS domain S-box-containing protein
MLHKLKKYRTIVLFLGFLIFIAVYSFLSEQAGAKYIEYFLFSNVFILLTLLLFAYKRLDEKHKGLIAFKTAVEDSYNTVVMTDKNKNIIFVNEMFEKITGYKKEEVLGKNPSILKSGIQEDGFYEVLNETISNGKKWHGRFVNRKKNGDLFYEDATITPIFVDGVISGYLAIKMDITQNVKDSQALEKLNQTLEERVQEELINNIEKERRLFESAKLASMGEMIGNIAHQWRQPLNTISAIVSSVKLDCSFNDLDANKLDSDMDMVIKQTNYLSDTIDTFRDFINTKKEIQSVVLQNTIVSAIHIVSTALEDRFIEIKENYKDTDPITITTIPQELSQVIINILNNAKDVLIEKDIKNRWIEISLYRKDDAAIITIEDNGGGIPQNVMPHIFEPYFTTKHKSNGTGLGLHMSYKIINKSLKGKIYAKNTKNGAKFYIELPINNKNMDDGVDDDR